MGNDVKATNRSARHEYFVLETIEAGIVLTGAEVKSVRAGKMTIGDAFIVVINGELFLRNAQIVPYEKGSYFNSEALRDRKLLVHRVEIERLAGKVARQGLTMIPLQVYFKGSLCKVEIALCKGKNTVDKRATIKERDTKREAERSLKNFR